MRKRKILKGQYGLNGMDLKLQIPQSTTILKQTNYANLDVGKLAADLNIPKLPVTNNQSKVKQGNSLGNQVAAQGVNVATDYLSNYASDKLFGNDSEVGRTMGTLFSSGLSSAGNTVADNLLKGQSLAQGLGQNVGSALAGAGVGIASNYIGQGITSAMGDSRLGRAIGAGVSTGLGTIGGVAASNLIKYGSIAGKAASGAQKASLFGKAAGAINPYGLAATVAGTALGAATGPSKEYGGKYGNITRTMDTIYDVATVAVNAIPGFGQLASGLMALNKGLSNVFGSTSGMTTQDAILGSAFMPAPLKWANVIGADTTQNFNNQSWQNSEKANTFMGDAFGNLNDKFDKAREEAGKTYGNFSRGAYNSAQNNLTFANYAWDKVLSMADQNELQNIRSQYMSSINNQRYAQQIGGVWQPIARGKLGMKIFNNATNHNMGMRLLSAAALIDNKAMILCNVHD